MNTKKGTVLWLIGIVLIVALALPAGFLVSARLSGPHLAFPQGPQFDFGVVDEGEIVKHEFPIRNAGGGVLRIVKLIAGCACTSVVSGKDALGPGETSTITVVYKSRQVTSREAITVAIQTNDPKTPYAQVQLTGLVRLRTFWVPTSVSFMAQHGKRDLFSDITFLTHEATGLHVEQIAPSSNKIVATWLGSTGTGKYTCRISLSPDCPPGTHTETVTVKCTAGSVSRTAYIPVHLMIQ